MTVVQHGIFYTQGPIAITIVFLNTLSTVLCIFTHERWSWEVDLLTVIWTDRSGTAERPACPAKAGTRERCGFLSAHQPGFVSLLAPSSHATSHPALREKTGRDESHGIVISDLTMSPRVVISLIRPGQHWGGVRTRAVTILVTRSEAGYFNICKSILSTNKVNV